MFPIRSPEDLEKISREAKWQYFEKIVGWIFEQNDFDVQVNKVVIFEKGDDKYRRQFDVIARRFDTTFLVECKKWSGSRYKVSALKEAVRSHEEKCSLYNIEHDADAVPIIVTLMQEEITEHDGIKVVPVGKLNCFLNGQTL